MEAEGREDSKARTRTRREWPRGKKNCEPTKTIGVKIITLVISLVKQAAPAHPHGLGGKAGDRASGNDAFAM
jgi:hypothetical protein